MNKKLVLFLSELVGTFLLVSVSCGIAMQSGDPLVIATGFGLTLFALVLVIGPISGCHINPAVTLGLWLARKIEGKVALIYVVAQFLGGLIGAFALLGLVKLGYGDLLLYGYGANTIINGNDVLGAVLASLAVEVFLTAIFVYAVLWVVHHRKGGIEAAAVVGGVLMLVHLFGVRLTGTSVNPARSFGPDLVAWIADNSVDTLKYSWVFIVGPLVGGALAFLVHHLVEKKK